MKVWRLVVNLGTIVTLAAVLVVYAAVQWVGGAFFEDRYELTVPIAKTGGLFLNQEVTVLGYGVGQIKDHTLTDEGVELLLDIKGDRVVPRHAVVQVLRRSALGEQALNFIPVPPDFDPPEVLIASEIETAEGWQAAERGQRIDPVATTFPTEIPPLLDEAVDLLNAIDTDELATVIHELSVAVGGRAELLKELNRDSLDLNTTLVEGIPEFRRLLDSSEIILDELNEHREALAGTFPPLADVSDLLARKRPALERLIDTSSDALREGTAFIENTRANQHCLMLDFTELNRMIAQEENLNDLSRGLRQARFFYQDGFDVITQFDPFRPGVAWQRINFLIFEHAGGQPYAPHRPTPQTKPGAACESPWGLGVNAVRQPDHQPPDETAPPIDFAPLAEGPSGSDGGTVSGPAPAPRGEDRGTTPATGGGFAAIVVPLALGAAWLSRRRR
ncbi:MAG: hypothetical protein KY437_08670 [Actinobacteria bacterium]|nr:hypothetical protein [Actinomycetota bacterium]